MATNTFNSVHHNYSLRRRRNLMDSPPPTTTINYPLSHKQTAAAHSLSHSAVILSASATNSNHSTSNIINHLSFDLLRHHLSSRNFRQADEETRRLLIALAGEPAQKRGYVFFSEVQFISERDLKTIDALWRQHSEGKYGYSVQRRIWKRVGGDFTRLFVEIGWMKKLEGGEVEQYNYRSFPAEFVWEMEDAAPEGHLPLTNALRGTQLLKSILNHPSFQESDGEEESDIKPNYTF